jgi:hypothetical protein
VWFATYSKVGYGRLGRMPGFKLAGTHELALMTLRLHTFRA